MLEQIDLIRKIANSESPVFIVGDTGTGKELVAKAIHSESARKDSKLMTVNCANLSEELLEAQIFGHVKGAFPEADSDQPGLLAMAENGTLYLDAVTEMPLNFQSKLLRALERKEYFPVGSSIAIPFNVRILSASSNTFETAVAAGKFREDLRYRFEVIPLHLPPLCEREADILPLFQLILEQQLCKYQVTLNDIDPLVCDCIQAYKWPGNIRELINVCVYIATLVNVGDKYLDVKLLPAVVTQAALEGFDSSLQMKKIAQLDKPRIEKILREFAGKRDSAARFLGVSRMTLWKRMNQLGV
jgi:transcriptional regulator with PAS, ATPase and Fis domain